MKIINKYILKEFIPQFLLGLIVFTFILLMDRIFTLTSLIINKGVPFLKVLKLFIFTLPSFFSLTIPMAFLMGSLLTLGRMQEDNEITAMRAGGISQVRIILPILIFGLFSSIGLMYFNQNIAPTTQKLFAKIYYEIAYQRPTLKLEENSFTELENYRLFAKKINRKKSTLKNVIIYKLDEKDYPLLITAKQGSLVQKETGLILNLFDGIIQKKNIENPSKFTQIVFEKYSFSLNLEKAITQMNDYTKNIINMTQKELTNQIKILKEQKIDTTIMKIQYHQRMTVAWACFTFVLLGAPLALMTHKHGKGIAFGLSLVLIFVFYSLLTIAISIAEKNILPCGYVLAMPNILVGSLGFFLIFKLNKH